MEAEGCTHCARRYRRAHSHARFADMRFTALTHAREHRAHALRTVSPHFVRTHCRARRWRRHRKNYKRRGSKKKYSGILPPPPPPPPFDTNHTVFYLCSTTMLQHLIPTHTCGLCLHHCRHPVWMKKKKTCAWLNTLVSYQVRTPLPRLLRRTADITRTPLAPHPHAPTPTPPHHTPPHTTPPPHTPHSATLAAPLCTTHATDTYHPQRV